MKNRKIPYGYEMQNGQIVINDFEAKIVKYIFDSYLAGSNLNIIAESLAKRQIEFLPGEYGWNKSRIKRMIEDKRYTGDEAYPAIINESIYYAVNAEKENRRNYTEPTVNGNNKPIIDKAVCSKCGKKIYHKTDNTKKNKEVWYCKTDMCRSGIPMTISVLEKKITSILNILIDNPERAENTESEINTEPSLEIKRIENEIARQLDSLDFDKDNLQSMILQCAAEKYNDDKSARHITDRLKADFEKSSSLSDFSIELFCRTVSAVIIEDSKNIQIKLKNGKIIRKE